MSIKYKMKARMDVWRKAQRRMYNMEESDNRSEFDPGRKQQQDHSSGTAILLLYSWGTSIKVTAITFFMEAFMVWEISTSQQSKWRRAIQERKSNLPSMSNLPKESNDPSGGLAGTRCPSRPN